jgi:hypothetical protein
MRIRRTAMAGQHRRTACPRRPFACGPAADDPFAWIIDPAVLAAVRRCRVWQNTLFRPILRAINMREATMQDQEEFVVIDVALAGIAATENPRLTQILDTAARLQAQL